MIPTLQILEGDCIAHLRTLRPKSIHCCVSSPPYYGLRDYGVDGQIGLEETPLQFIQKMVEVYREVRRVLRDDGTVWLNMGDSYASKPGGGQGAGGQMVGRAVADARNAAAAIHRGRKMPFKPKDMMGMPWRLAFALQDDGWYLRQDIIWQKPNPMPESVNDRCCKSHEYIFLLTKSERYFFDAEAIKEPVSGTVQPRGSGVNAKAKAPNGWDTSTGEGGHGTIHRGGRTNGTVRTKQNESFSAAVAGLVSTRNKRSVWTVPTEACKEAHFATFPKALIRPCIEAGTPAGGVCVSCGSPFRRLMERGAPDLDHQRACGGDLNGEYHGKATKDYKAGRAEDPSEVKARILRGMVGKRTVAWLPTCDCDGRNWKKAGEPRRLTRKQGRARRLAGRIPESAPAVVLDEFCGSGTTGEVSLEMGRSSILIELNPAYADIARKRTAVTPGFKF